MKFYLAARYSRRPELVKYREFIERHGGEVTSRWLDRREGKVMTEDDTLNDNSLIAGTSANRKAIAEAEALAEASRTLGERIEARDDHG